MLRHPWNAEDVLAALCKVPAESQRLFLEIIQHPEYTLGVLTSSFEVAWRDEPVGGLNRHSGEWFLAKNFVGPRGGPAAADEHGFDLRVRLADRHAYWGLRGATAVDAFRATVEKMTGAALTPRPAGA